MISLARSLFQGDFGSLSMMRAIVAMRSRISAVSMSVPPCFIFEDKNGTIDRATKHFACPFI